MDLQDMVSLLLISYSADRGARWHEVGWCHRMVPVIVACPAIVGTTEAVYQSQRKNARKRHRGAKTNLVVSCSNSEIDGCPVVLCD